MSKGKHPDHPPMPGGYSGPAPLRNQNANAAQQAVEEIVAARRVWFASDGREATYIAKVESVLRKHGFV